VRTMGKYQRFHVRMGQSRRRPRGRKGHGLSAVVPERLVELLLVFAARGGGRDALARGTTGNGFGFS